ncbi:MAG: DNA gyrase inhibitor YacG [Candidatus Rokubacteria bacterium]|nr:DNA gyrase inhibitor YacG [Candidatus Rokubacteria bacterium]
MSLPSPDCPPLVPRCRTCRREARWQDNSHRPFCSLTCRLLDLGVWLDEEYRIPGAEAAALNDSTADGG